MIKKAGIIGLGLIGGSIAKALRFFNVCDKITACDKNFSYIEQALKEGVVDTGSLEPDLSFSDCDIIFICTPVDVLKKYIELLHNLAGKDVIITDAGSTKTDIMKYVEDNRPDLNFIGGHPMAGSEKSGYLNSSAYLFENAYYILTPFSGTPESKIDKLKSVIESINAIPLILDYKIHDFVTAAISHVPHIMAAILVNSVKCLDTKNKYMHMLAAGGFKDITRIASSSPSLWKGICMSNSDNIIKILDHLLKGMETFKQNLINNSSGYIQDYFKEAGIYRDSLSHVESGSILAVYKIIVDVPDKPGVIAEIAGLLSKKSINIKNIGIVNNRELAEGALEITFSSLKQQESGYEILKTAGYKVSIPL